ncbi:TPA: shufflon system plasmid conjugative transfer pilus tip adhesin PilV [Salmonella enterica subsp. salamae serovar 35:g,m,s,t:-]|nr:shufflon system plasmid conjugative transfer pilus tip adhesin PilV [Salmonella enterica subsp. salamae serovar 35:g,m,s,t:-]HCA3549665.1 shufflon system plasmid conjugative transfer pilus tip adhesin PilV [Salmonella enterica subsp. salamae serovar 35:g,m,s,t:-]
MKMKSKTARKVHNGLTLIEASVVILLIMLMMALASVYWKNSTNNAEYNSTATQLNTVTNAAVDYIHDNYSNISKNVSAGKPYYVTGQQLRDAGYLMTGYSLTNNSHQDYQVAIGVNPKFSDRLVAFVLTQNGTEIPMDGLRTISAYAGGMAGYVHDDNVAEGAYGGWNVTLTDYGMTAKKGHLVSFISSDKLGANTDAGDRLYRYSVDGHPALNQMQTSIDMDSNDLNNVSTVNTADLAASNTITTKEMTASDTINTNILAATTVKATGDVTATGSVTGNTVRSNGRLSTGEYLQLDKVATAGTACSPNGLVSRDSNGAILSCQSGVWGSSASGWKMPPPQTISCNIKDSGTYQAKIDSDGQIYTISPHDTGWILGASAPVTDYTGYPEYASVGLQGLEGHGIYRISSCHQTTCNYSYTPDTCAAMWKY